MPQEFKSVWDALETNPVEAANLKLRSSLMMEISEFVKKTKLTQAEAAKKTRHNTAKAQRCT